ncbi:MAG TPA: hypothetical protein VGF25_05130 [Thermoleophilaceae bacterium]|jgi:hypothetical protein
MSTTDEPGPGELAATQVKEVVAAAQAAAERIKEEARRVAEEELAEARRAADEELEHARRQAIEFDRDTRREANRIVDEAKREAAATRAETQRAVEGRVERAERAASEVLADAQALSEGLRQLGELLTEQGERILREVHAAHRQMQADLKVGPGRPGAGAEPADLPPAARERPRPGTSQGRERLDVPTWVAGQR